jgi:hypothetical protein
MKTKLTQEQADNLEKAIYLLLMQNPEFDFGDMTNCMESANFLVKEWAKKNNIKLP